jgi:hypothetical protein
MGYFSRSGTATLFEYHTGPTYEAAREAYADDLDEWTRTAAELLRGSRG